MFSSIPTNKLFHLRINFAYSHRNMREALCNVLLYSGQFGNASSTHRITVNGSTLRVMNNEGRMGRAVAACHAELRGWDWDGGSDSGGGRPQQF